MELRQLRYFVAVAEELHFGRAAQRVHISGPAPSQQIIALERELGAELFVRDRRSVRLSEAGRTLLSDARRILSLADDAKRRLQRAAALSTPLRLGYVSWLPDDINSIIGPTVARIARIDDGGITGDAFYAHVRKVGAAVLASPKRHTAPIPPSLGQRPAAGPIPLWTWSLVHRQDDARGGVRSLVNSLRGIARSRGWLAPPAEPWWTPADDPHRGALESGADLR